MLPPDFIHLLSTSPIRMSLNPSSHRRFLSCSPIMRRQFSSRSFPCHLSLIFFLLLSPCSVTLSYLFSSHHAVRIIPTLSFFSLLLLSVTAVIEWPFDMEDCNGSIKLSMSTRNSFFFLSYFPSPPLHPKFYLSLMCVPPSHFS